MFKQLLPDNFIVIKKKLIETYAVINLNVIK